MSKQTPIPYKSCTNGGLFVVLFFPIINGLSQNVLLANNFVIKIYIIAKKINREASFSLSVIDLLDVHEVCRTAALPSDLESKM